MHQIGKLATTGSGLDVVETKAMECSEHGAYLAKRVRWGGREMPLQPCPECRKAENDRERSAELAKMDAERRQARIDAIMRRSGIPERFKARRFENYVAENDGQRRALQSCEQYAREFDDVRKIGRCLILAGNPGTGKTHLACSIANHLMPLGRSALFIGALDAIKRIRATWARDSDETELQVMRAFREVDLLILDEVGTQFGTEAEMTQVFEIINGRYMDVKPTVVLTNVFHDKLEAVIGHRSLDRLRENGGRLVPFEWDSYRSKA